MNRKFILSKLLSPILQNSWVVPGVIVSQISSLIVTDYKLNLAVHGVSESQMQLSLSLNTYIKALFFNENKEKKCNRIKLKVSLN